MESQGKDERKALRGAAKVAVGFKMLQSGAVSTMSQDDYEKFLNWLEAEA